MDNITDYRMTFLPSFYVCYPIYTRNYRKACFTYLRSFKSFGSGIQYAGVLSRNGTLTIVDKHYHEFQQIFRREGFTGLYRGYFLSVINIYALNIIRSGVYELFCFWERITRRLLIALGLNVPAVDSSKLSLRSPPCSDNRAEGGEPLRPSAESSSAVGQPATNRIFPTIYEDCEVIIKRQHDEGKNDSLLFGGTKSWILQMDKKIFEELSLKKLFSKYIAEILSYPLLTCATRVIVYEGAEKLGYFDIIQLTYLFDGFWGFYGGLYLHLLRLILSDLINIGYVALRIFSPFGCSVYTAFLIREASIALLVAAATPFNKLAIIQRSQSNMEGLCLITPAWKVLGDMPYGGILGFAKLLVVPSLFCMLNIMVPLQR